MPTSHGAGSALPLTAPFPEIDYLSPMDAVRQIIEKASIPLVIDLPMEYKGHKVEVIVLPLDEPGKPTEKKYDFSQFFGKMNWEGDALAEQKRLRDEWD